MLLVAAPTAELFVVFTLFTAALFSIVTFTREGQFIQNVDSNPRYFIQQVCAQEGDEEVTAGESAKVDDRG